MEKSAAIDYENSSATEIFFEIITAFKLPEEATFLECLQDTEGRFQKNESLLYDYKVEFPFSQSDSYFGGIMRAICGFHNSHGGLIIFGVHDVSRTAGKNEVVIDTEKVQRRLREDLSQEVNIEHNAYETKTGKVDVLLIAKRNIGVPPVRLNRKIDKYLPEHIYYREGPEVLNAQLVEENKNLKDLEWLYGERDHPSLETMTDNKIPQSLPASPSTLDTFIGRFQVVEDTMDWLLNKHRQPRLFLWGSGGSGKSSIAYEIASIVAQNGNGLLDRKNGQPFERVIYVSAKKTFLDPISAKIETFEGTDFTGALQLFRTILDLAHWTDETIKDWDEERCIEELEAMFDLEKQLIVIDDIDTVSTSEEDAGMEQLYNIVARCASQSKILYTLRNIPSYAKVSSIEVPGLDIKYEFPPFIKACVQKFKVSEPSLAEKEKIADISERRPLAIETILGLRRKTSSYEDAIKRWGSSGSQARDYLFSREYEQLDKSNKSRYLLATLSMFEQPVSSDALANILNFFSEEQIQDAIAECRDMFLKVTQEPKQKTDMYTLGLATRSYVLEVSKALDKFPNIQAKVRQYQSGIIAPNQALNNFIMQVIKRSNRDHGGAIKLMENKELPPAMIEHPSFKRAYAKLLSKSKPPRLMDARELFDQSLKLVPDGQNKDHELFHDWLRMEDDHGTGSQFCIDVCAKATRSDISPLQKSKFYRSLGYHEFKLANNLESSSPEESAKLRASSLTNNVWHFNTSDANLHVKMEKVSKEFEKFTNFCMRQRNVNLFLKRCRVNLRFKKILEI